MTSIDDDSNGTKVELNQGCGKEECRAKIRELGEQVIGLRKRLQCMERERLKHNEMSRDFGEAERNLEETSRRYRELRAECDVLE